MKIKKEKRKNFMNKLFVLISIIISFNCYSNTNPVRRNMTFIDISKILSVNEFEKIKNFILKKGDRQTYRNFDNDNPHYGFNGFEVFLASDIGQKNIRNDPAKSDFNELTIYDRKASIQYYRIFIVRKGDIKSNKFGIKKGMKEGKVYLVDVYENGINALIKILPKYLEKIKTQISLDN